MRSHSIDLSPTVTVTEDGKTIYWYTIQQLEYLNHKRLMSKIDATFKKMNKHEDNSN